MRYILLAIMVMCPVGLSAKNNLSQLKEMRFAKVIELDTIEKKISDIDDFIRSFLDKRDVLFKERLDIEKKELYRNSGYKELSKDEIVSLCNSLYSAANEFSEQLDDVFDHKKDIGYLDFSKILFDHSKKYEHDKFESIKFFILKLYSKYISLRSLIDFYDTQYKELVRLDKQITTLELEMELK